jgi:hypothetical protein
MQYWQPPCISRRIDSAHPYFRIPCSTAWQPPCISRQIDSAHPDFRIPCSTGNLHASRDKLILLTPILESHWIPLFPTGSNHVDSSEWLKDPSSMQFCMVAVHSELQNADFDTRIERRISAYRNKLPTSRNKCLVDSARPDLRIPLASNHLNSIKSLKESQFNARISPDSQGISRFSLLLSADTFNSRSSLRTTMAAIGLHYPPCFCQSALSLERRCDEVCAAQGFLLDRSKRSQKKKKKKNSPKEKKGATKPKIGTRCFHLWPIQLDNQRNNHIEAYPRDPEPRKPPPLPSRTSLSMPGTPSLPRPQIQGSTSGAYGL